MDEFVCLRMIQMNGVDLAQFQFDFDMSFAVFFMNPDGAIYGRYGTRADRPDEADRFVSLEGLAASMEAALALHRNYPGNADVLQGKKGPKPEYARAELYPQLTKYTPKINYENEVAKSCIHCHQIHNAERQELRDAGKSIPDVVLYPYPIPDVVGIRFDPDTRATVAEVAPNSPADLIDLQPGDQMLKANEQPLVSMADFQWVLHHASPGGATIPIKLWRQGKVATLDLVLEDGWRKKTDFTWRVSTWDLRRMVLGGMVLEPDKSAPTGLAVKGAGKYGEHGVARRAGVREGDVILEIAGIHEPSTEAQVIAHLLSTTKKGDSVAVSIRRNGKEMSFTFNAQ